MQSSALHFAAAARTLGDAARRRRLLVPAFRSPPRRPGAARTVRRWPDGGATVSVEVVGRPHEAVVADMVEGIVVVNRLAGAEATRVRTALWEAVTADAAVSVEAA